MQVLSPSYNTSLEAVNTLLVEIHDELTAIHVEYLPGKNQQDPYDLQIAVWALVKNTIHCYYINFDGLQWVIRQCNRNDFTATRFISCPLPFLKAIDLEQYDPAWIEAVRKYHRSFYK